MSRGYGRGVPGFVGMPREAAAVMGAGKGPLREGGGAGRGGECEGGGGRR